MYVSPFKVKNVECKDSFLRLGYHKSASNPHGYHWAIDFSRYYLDGKGWYSLAGQTVAAVIGGTVTECRRDPAWGNTVRIKGTDGKYWRYAHLKYLPALKAGQKVAQGYRFGYVGNTGNSTGPHLHIEVSLGPSRDPRQNPYEIFSSFSGGEFVVR